MIQTDFFESFLHLFFPRLCAACDQVLLAQEEMICLDCAYHLPFTDFHVDSKNDTARQLVGKLEFDFAISMLYLAKSSRVENLIHRLKYKNDPEIGQFLGIMYAKRLQESGLLATIDLIVPIPLHNSRFRKRGYNQSAYFAKGIAEESGIEMDDIILLRTVASESQTKKNRLERYDNVETVFQLNETYFIADKHLLLVDDILTTGATICSAGNLLTSAGAKVSVATIARA